MEERSRALEGLDPLIDPGFWRGRKVFVTGHTGFKGSWLSLWLSRWGAKVTGYALPPATVPSLFDLGRVGDEVASIIGDVRDRGRLAEALRSHAPEIVIHMAAQPLVLESYRDPAGTYETNVIGTVNLLEAVRGCPSVRAVVNVTTDKCYENTGRPGGCREDDPMGGFDPYSSSKACSELVTAAYRRSFFEPANGRERRVGVATARSGNVIGGGDWARDRLVPDCIRAILDGTTISIRHPDSVRPWQHVLEPLGGYLLLSRKLYENGSTFAEAWNFGPQDGEARPVRWLVQRLCERWGDGARIEIDRDGHPHEAERLELDCSKARSALAWCPRWPLETAIDKVVEWTRAYRDGGDVKRICLDQIEEYLSAGGGPGR